MASPHVAGLVAYLLSIYPSKTFNPPTSEPLPDLGFENQHPFSRISSVYSFVHASLPNSIARFLPSPEFFEPVAPIPDLPQTLSPQDMKRALIALASEGKLTELPDKTPNLLVFNNATES